MNKKILILIPIVIIIIVIIFILKRNDKVMIKDTTRFRLFFTNGYMMNADTEYEYELKDDKYIMTIKPYLVSQEEAISFEVDKSVVEEIETILNKYDVYKWDGFSKSDKNVLDGDSFSFSVRMKEEAISASGYMKWPKNYGNVKEEVSTVFERELLKNKVN